MTEEHMQWWELLKANEEHTQWLIRNGLTVFSHAAYQRCTHWHSIAMSCEYPLTSTEFMATIQYTSDVDRLTPAQYTRYCRIKYGDPTIGRRGY